MRAVFNGLVIAEAPRTRRVEGVDYFPPESLKHEYFTQSATRSLCPWKGAAHYRSVTVDGVTGADAAWYYPHPGLFARRIKNHVAFRHGVTVEGTPER